MVSTLTNFGDFHAAKAHPSVKHFLLYIHLLLPPPSSLVGGRYSIWAMLWHLWERYLSLSTQAMCGGIILQWPFHLWPPMGSSSWLGQIGGGEGQQTLSPFPIICPAVDCLPLDGFLSGVVALQHAHGVDV